MGINNCRFCTIQHTEICSVMRVNTGNLKSHVINLSENMTFLY